MKKTRTTSYPAILGDTSGKMKVMTAPSRKVSTVVDLRPARSKIKPITKTVGMAMPWAYDKLFAAIFEASAGSLSK